MWRADSLEKILMLGKIEGRRRRGWQRMRWLWHRRQWDLWAEHLVFVKRSKTEPLFSSRHSKDKASGKSWAALKQRDKVASPEGQRSLTCLHMCRKASWESNQEGSPPHDKYGHAPIGLWSGIHLRKMLHTQLGEDPRTSQEWRKKQDNWPEV